MQVWLLGDFELHYNGDTVTTINSARLQSLLAYLLINRSSPQLRHHIAFQFWPDTTEAQARTNLRKLILLLRRALPDADSFLHVTNKSVQWRPEAALDLDVARFEQGCAAQESPQAWQTAVNLYRGQLLPSSYDDWILPVRERLHQMYVETTDRLIDRFETEHDFQQAIHYAQHLLRQEPLREPTYRKLMRLYMSLGERSSALRIYHSCTTNLRRELDVEPSAETQALYQQLMGVKTAHSPSLPETAPFPTEVPVAPTTASIFGRVAEWQELISLWSNLTPPQSRFVLITGEAGIGKSHLAEQYLHWANKRGVTVARTRSWSGEGRLAYTAVADLLRSEGLRPQITDLNDVWLEHISRLLPELREEKPHLPIPAPLQEDWQRQQFFEALTRAVTAHHKPLLMLFDDLQWSDGQTLEWLHFVLRYRYDQPLLVVGAARVGAMVDNEALTRLLLSLRQNDQMSEIELRPLDQEDVAMLASQVTGQELDLELAEQLYRRTEGNPLFVVEAVRAGIRLDENEQAREETASDVVDSMPPKIKAVIQSRFTQLSPLAQELASIAAVIGRSFTFSVLAGAAEHDESALIIGLDELWRRRVVRELEAATYDFSHDYIREFVYEYLSPIRRRILHQRVAHALEEVYRDKTEEVYGELAVHYEHARADEQATVYRLRAGQSALDNYAFEDAIRHFQRAVDLSEEAESFAEAHLGLSRAYFASDEPDLALTHVVHAKRYVAEQSQQNARLCHLEAEIHFARYEIEPAISAASAAQHIAEAVGDQEIVCQCLSLLGQTYSARGEVDTEIKLIHQALDICRKTQNRWREGRTLADLGWLQAQRGEFVDAVASADQARQILSTTEDLAGLAFAWNVLGRAYGGCGSYTAAFAAFRQSQTLATAIDHKFLLAQVPNMLGWLYQQLCDYAQAFAHDQEGVSLARSWEKMPAEISARINVALDHLYLGNPDHALAQLHQIQNQIEQTKYGFHSWRWRLRLLYAQGLCQLGLQRPTAAYELALEGLELSRSTTSNKYVALNQALLGNASLALGQKHEAISALTSAVELADKIAYQPLRWERRWTLATIYTTEGDHEQARSWTRQAKQIIDDIADDLDETPLRSTFLGSSRVRAILQANIGADG